MKSLALAIQFNEVLVNPGPMLISNNLFIPCVITHLHRLHHHPFTGVILVVFYFKLHSDLVRHYCEEIKHQILLDGFFFKVGTMLMVIEAIILDVGEHPSQISSLC